MGLQLNLEGRARWAVEGRDLGLSLGVLVCEDPGAQGYPSRRDVLRLGFWNSPWEKLEMFKMEQPHKWRIRRDRMVRACS